MKSNDVSSRGQVAPAKPSPGGVWEWPSEFGAAGTALLFLLVVLSYGLGSQLAFMLIDVSGLQGVFFIPAGITVAILIRLSPTLWWVVLSAAGLTELTMDLLGGFSPGESVGFAIANVSAPLVGASIVISACGSLDLARRKHVLWFTLGAVVAGPAVGAGLGATADFVFAGDQFGTTFAQWWLGDALGVILVGSAILVWGSSPDRRPILSYGGAAVIGLTVLATVAILALTGFLLVFLVLVIAVVSGALFGPRTTSMTALSVAVTVAIVVAIDPDAIATSVSPAEALVVIKLQIGISALAGLAVAAEAHEREVAVTNAAIADLEREVLDRERQREHDLAVQVQRGLFPDRTVDLAGFDVAMEHRTAEESFEVGGDWYDVITLSTLSPRKLGVVVGDIMGHGIRAMTSMGRLRTALSALALHAVDPAALLTEVDEFVGGPDGTDYATVFYAIVEPESESIQYASAGHPPALLLTEDGKASWLDAAQSEPLTGNPGAYRQWATAPFVGGSTLVLYTDGLVERRGESLDSGLSRLAASASNLRTRSARAICDSLIAELYVPEGGEDDVAILVMKASRDSLKPFHHTYSAVPRELARIRSQVRSWLDELGLPQTTKDDTLLALSEAISNVVRHAYDSEIGEVEVRISALDGILEAEVSDSGVWRSASAGEQGPGFGLQILRDLTSRFDIDTSQSGTILSFAIPISDAANNGRAEDEHP